MRLAYALDFLFLCQNVVLCYFHPFDTCNSWWYVEAQCIFLHNSFYEKRKCECLTNDKTNGILENVTLKVKLRVFQFWRQKQSLCVNAIKWRIVIIRGFQWSSKRWSCLLLIFDINMRNITRDQLQHLLTNYSSCINMLCKTNMICV